MTFPIPRDELLAKFPKPNKQSILDDIAKQVVTLRDAGAQGARVDCYVSHWAKVRMVEGDVVRVEGMSCGVVAKALRAAGYRVAELPRDMLDVDF